MEPTDSVLVKLASYQGWIIAILVLLTVLAYAIAWWLKSEPKTLLTIVGNGLGLVVAACVALYFVRSSANDPARLMREGVPAVATVLQVEGTGVSMNRRAQVRMRLRVQLEGKPAYEVMHTDYVGLGQAVIPGRPLAVFVDRAKPEMLFIDWSGSTAPTPAGPASQGDVSKRLADLDRLRQAGQITEAEYQAHRARLLSEL
jgi:hypothetical protein